MKQLIIMAAFLLTASVVFATDTPQQKETDTGQQNFDNKKAEVLSNINKRIARNKEELSCVQAAKTPADLKACRDKFREAVKEIRPGYSSH